MAEPSPDALGARWKDGGPIDFAAGVGRPAAGAPVGDGRVVVLGSLDEVRLLAERPLDRAHVRAVIAPFIPSGYVSLLASEGIAAFQIDPKDLEAAKHEATKGAKSISLPPLAKWSTEIAATAGKAKLALTWLASPAERNSSPPRHAGDVMFFGSVPPIRQLSGRSTLNSPPP